MRDKSYLVTLRKPGSGTRVLPEVTSLEDVISPLTDVGDEITITVVPVTQVLREA